MVLEVVKVHVKAKFHQTECSSSCVIMGTNFFCPLTIVKNPKIRSCDLGLWPKTLKFSGFRAVVKVHAHTKFCQAKCSSSWITNKTPTKKPRVKSFNAQGRTSQGLKDPGGKSARHRGEQARGQIFQEANHPGAKRKRHKKPDTVCCMLAYATASPQNLTTSLLSKMHHWQKFGNKIPAEVMHKNMWTRCGPISTW